MVCGGDNTVPKTIDYTGTGTIIDTFEKWCEVAGNDQFLCQPMGGKEDNLKFHTFAEARDEAVKMATYISSLGFEKGDRIALMSKNCSWWFLADLAIVMAGYVTVPVYPTLTANTVEYILTHSEAKLLFVGKLDVAPWEEMKKGISDIKVVTFPLCPAGYEDGVTWSSILQQEATPITPVKRSPEELATIIYTSGSTGQPKGVMHDFNTMYNTTKGFCTAINAVSTDRYMSYLPLAHGMERWLGECVALYNGNQVFFADSLATFRQDLVRAKPTLFVSVPRLWTKFQQGVHANMPPAKLNFLLKVPILNALVRKKILKALGLDTVRIAGSGSAPIPADLIKWYNNLGLELLEGYGMTENFNYSHMSKPGNGCPGSVGEAYDDVDVRIADDGEIQLKTPGLMMGYYKNEEATAECVMPDGYLRTGDRGTVDSKGRLFITGRSKEIFKTSKGKYVAPAPIETKFINNDKVELACVGGSSFPAAHVLVQISDDQKSRLEKGSQAVKDAFAKQMEDHLKAVNGTVDDHEACQFMVLVKEVWLPENGFLTPTQKIVRSKIEAEYAPNNETWYSSKKAVIWHGW